MPRHLDGPLGLAWPFELENESLGLHWRVILDLYKHERRRVFQESIRILWYRRTKFALRRVPFVRTSWRLVLVHWNR